MERSNYNIFKQYFIICSWYTTSWKRNIQKFNFDPNFLYVLYVLHHEIKMLQEHF